MKTTGELDQEFGERASQMLRDRPFDSLCLTAQAVILQAERKKNQPPVAVDYSEDLNLRNYSAR